MKNLVLDTAENPADLPKRDFEFELVLLERGIIEIRTHFGWMKIHVDFELWITPIDSSSEEAQDRLEQFQRDWELVLDDYFCDLNYRHWFAEEEFQDAITMTFSLPLNLHQ